jgi:hypothetical protein
VARLDRLLDRLSALERRQLFLDRHRIPPGQEAEYQRRYAARDRLAQARERDLGE